ncbi:MAG: PIN domain-containing protein [Bacteroidetes bacterium]|nr:PIN domain-containing protein [Bacteroidota bacterium]
MKEKDVIRVYVDTNVLINYCTGQSKDKAAVLHLSKKRSRESLFTSSLAVVQTVSALQSAGKNNRKAYSREQTIQKLNKILPKFTLLDLTESDITESFALVDSNDIEDCVHYVISQKRHCDAIVTNDKKGFDKFKNIEVYGTDIDILKTDIQ